MGWDKLTRKRKGKRVAQSYYARARSKRRIWWPPYVEIPVEAPPETKQESEPSQQKPKRRRSKENIPEASQG
jgi:hypothetical protein